MAPKAKKGAKANFPFGSSHIHPNLLSNSDSPSPNSALLPNVNLSTFTPISAFGTPAVTVSRSARKCLGTTSIYSTLTPNQAVLAFSNSTLLSVLMPNLSSLVNLGSQQSPGIIVSSQPTLVMSPHNPMKDLRSLSVPAKGARERPKKTQKQEKTKEAENNTEDRASQALWLEKPSDGYSDMDIIAMWCSDSDNYSHWCDRIPNKRAVAGSIATDLKDMRHWKDWKKRFKRR
ncbi:hypothetical protein DFH28DRAFT_926334 [Melampsora americana]|nr:hypothetical protein DFH28DRAFT_926334 [Melampsora americana]